MASARAVLELLRRNELVAAISRLGVAVSDRRKKAPMVEALMASKRRRHVVDLLASDRLLELARQLGVDDVHDADSARDALRSCLVEAEETTSDEAGAGGDDDEAPSWFDKVVADLQWVAGAASPTGRRVLHVKPATSELTSATDDPDIAHRFAADCPVEPGIFERWPTNTTHAKVTWEFDDDELRRLELGFHPEVMEDKWQVVSARRGAVLRVCFLRSWTGMLAYVFEVEHGSVRDVTYDSDFASPMPTLRAIMDGYLFGRTCIIPAPSQYGDRKAALLQHGMAAAGRRCDFVEPSTSRLWLVSGADPGRRSSFPTPVAIERQLPREVMDEAMGSRSAFALHHLFKTVVAMLHGGVRRAREMGVLPTEDAVLNHDELAILRRWLDGVAGMDESQLRTIAQGLYLEADGPTEDPERDEPRAVFGQVGTGRWLVWGRGAVRGLLRAHVDPARTVDVDSSLVDRVRAVDPRFALGDHGCVAEILASGADLVALVSDAPNVRGWMDGAVEGELT